MKQLLIRCKKAAKALKHSRDAAVLDELYYFLPRLGEAARVFSRHGSEAVCDGIGERLALRGSRADRDDLRAYLKKIGAGDDDVRLLRYYLILIYAELACRGETVTAQLREAEKLDFDELTVECSPLEGRLLLCEDYRISDAATRAEYRRRLRRYARRKRTDPISALSSLPPHRLTGTLFGKEPAAPFHAVLLFLITAALVLSVYLFCGAAVAVFAALPLYSLSSWICAELFRRLVPPRLCPRVNGSVKLPPCLIVRTVLLDGDGAKAVADLKKLYYTEGKNENVYFGLLADLPDCEKPESENDAKIISGAEKALDELRAALGDRFFLFYRKRRYSYSEDAFIAPERKRGAVCELVRQLKTGSSSLIIRGDASVLTGIPYIITLDSDTLLYPGSSDALLRSACHPANRPVTDRDKRIVVSGHGILQPRVSAKLCGEDDSLFRRAFSSDSGIDPYHPADFDVNGAVYGRGVFCGKGLIDVSAFYDCCVDVFDDGIILSHDAIEGCRCRCGAVTDVVMYENTPKNALSYFKRLHRWIRGDFQSLYCVRKVGSGKKRVSSALPVFDRFTLYRSAAVSLDSLCAAGCLTAGLITGTLPAAAVAGLSYLTVPLLFSCARLIGYAPALSSALCYLFMRISFIFREACVSADAALRALFRLFTKKRTLQWTTSSAADTARRHHTEYLYAFLPSVVFGAALTVLSSGAALFTGALICLSPVIAFFSSLPGKRRRVRVTERDLIIKAVSDHMKYFDDLVNAEHNYLPPDNYQVLCGVGAAPRTSPTNIGLYLLSVVASVDLGLYGAETIYERLSPTLRTLLSLEKRGGLLYNWYDTHTGAPLSDFVSTVDCGNYLCCLVALRSAVASYSAEDGRLAGLYGTVDGLIAECDLSPLYNEKTDRFRIGSEGDGEYDLFCSEMRSTDILSVAFGFCPAKHMGALGRPVTGNGERRGIASWSGTAFEYFMPAMFLPSPPESSSGRALAYAAYIQYGKGVRFGGGTVSGSSESCYYALDAGMNYQYKAHGENGLALCADRSDRVISPYSSFLMLGHDRRAVLSLFALKAGGAYGKYGFYEAVDFTRERVGSGYAVIKCFMAHHIGMSVVSACNALCGDIFVRRFCEDERIAAVLPLLYEKFPGGAPYKKPEAVPSPPAFSGFSPSDGAVAQTNTVCTAVSNGASVGLYYKGLCICDESSPEPLTLLREDGAIRQIRAGAVGVCGAELFVCPDCTAFAIDCGGGVSTLRFSPVMADKSVYRRHRAYSALFVTSERDGDVIRFIKRGKDGFCVSVAAFDRGILPVEAKTRADLIFGGVVQSVYGACVFPRLEMTARSDSVRFVIAAGNDRESADAALMKASASEPAEAGVRVTDPALFGRLLSCVLDPAPKQASGRGGDIRQTLYGCGISGDRPVILLDGRGDGGMNRIRSLFPSVASAALAFLILRIGVDTVVLYDGDDGYFNRRRDEIVRLCGACGLAALFGERIFAVNGDGGAGAALCDIAVCRVRSPSDVSAAGIPEKPAGDVRRRGAAPVFEGGSVTLSPSVTYAPMSYIYANPCFGALLTDRDGGFCWYGNSRMYQLTGHATLPGRPGERLYFDRGGASFDLYGNASSVTYHPDRAVYRGEIAGAPYAVTVSVDSSAPFKAVRISAAVRGTVRLVCSPVLGEKFENGTLRFAQTADTVTVSRAYGDGVPSLFVHCSGCAADFDGKILTVCACHEKNTVIVEGAAFSRSAVEYAVKNAGGAAKRYARRLEEYLSPFRLHGAGGGIDLFFNLFARQSALVCRQFARCGYYQNGGAYGFRDQLQDCLCTVYGAPLLSRAHILRCAAHQYAEGDVMHWFHPLTETGVRTRCSDDMLWLPYVVSEYVRITGDKEILSKKIRYLGSPPLDSADRYEKAVPSALRESLLMHCVRAVSRIRLGAHGLCLFGGGDWNDGMNEAGALGRGESVWLSLFAADVYRRMYGLTGQSTYLTESDRLIRAVEEHCYDGSHYLRGYLDDGSPLGATGAEYCEIDVLPQAFAAMIGLDRERVKSSMNDVYEKLYDRDHGILKLCSPPFDGQRGIGYIASYPPGIRENGGQYTHAALWGAMGFFAAGMHHKGYEILKALCPVDRCRTLDGFLSYGREPYTLCGDVSSADGLCGTGGWSFYTGASGWYFNAVLGSLLGYREHDGGFEISPAFCSEFSRFTLTVKRHGTEYTVNAEDVPRVTMLDGVGTERTFFPFDHGKHTLDIGRKR